MEAGWQQQVADAQAAVVQAQSTAEGWRQHAEALASTRREVCDRCVRVCVRVCIPRLVHFHVFCLLPSLQAAVVSEHTAVGPQGPSSATALHLAGFGVEDAISRAVAAGSVGPTTGSDATDLVHRVAVAESLLAAAKSTLQERAVQAAVLTDTINALQAAIDEGISDGAGGCSCCDVDCDYCGGRDGGDGRGPVVGRAIGDLQRGDAGHWCACGHEGTGGGEGAGADSTTRVQLSHLSRRVVELTAQVTALTKGAPVAAMAAAHQASQSLGE
jgi:hypothetical protein